MDIGLGSFSFSVWAFLAVAIAAFTAYFIFVFLKNSNTAPKITKEGFGAPVVGAGMPDCLHESAEAAAIIGTLTERVQTSEEGRPDLEELKVLLSKLTCMKRDLVSTAGVVNATLYQPFATAHDVEPVAETVGRCFAKTIPQRDLEISFDKWKNRGRFLLLRLCTAAGLNAEEKAQINAQFDSVLVDVFDIAQQKCIPGQPEIMGKATPREPKPFSAPDLEYLRPYTGYY